MHIRVNHGDDLRDGLVSLAHGRKIAEAHGSRTDSEHVHKANNPWPMGEFSTRAPGLDWPTYFEAAGLSGQPVVVVWQTSGIAGSAALVGSLSFER